MWPDQVVDRSDIGEHRYRWQCVRLLQVSSQVSREQEPSAVLAANSWANVASATASVTDCVRVGTSTTPARKLPFER